jgi:hypothetical protein
MWTLACLTSTASAAEPMFVTTPAPDTGSIVLFVGAAIRSDRLGVFEPSRKVGDLVRRGDVLGVVDPLRSPEVVRRRDEAAALRATEPASSSAAEAALASLKACQQVPPPGGCSGPGRAAADAAARHQILQKQLAQLEHGLTLEVMRVTAPSDGLVAAVRAAGEVQPQTELAVTGDPASLGAEVLTTLPCASFRDVVLRTESGVEVAGTVRAAVPQPTAVQLAPACLLEVVPLGDPWPAGLVGQRVIFAR